MALESCNENKKLRTLTFPTPELQIVGVLLNQWFHQGFCKREGGQQRGQVGESRFITNNNGLNNSLREGGTVSVLSSENGSNRVGRRFCPRFEVNFGFHR